MYISVGKGEKTANTGSCAPLVTYLEKENKEGQEQTYFFDQDREGILAEEVIETIDQNIQKLGKTDAKYFMVTISPSEEELRHIQNNTEELKAYARAVMEEYAAGFDRGITGADLVYFGKIEHGRKFTGADKAVQLGLEREGDPKPGLHTHVHIVVSRKDKTQRLKLSPETNHRTNRGSFQGGFDKIKFFIACEQAFDQRFKYPRTPEEKFSHRKENLTPTLATQEQLKQVQLAIAATLQEKPTLLSFAKQLFKQNIRPVFEKDANGQVIGMNYQLVGKDRPTQGGGKIILTHGEAGKPMLGVQLKRQVGSKVAQRLLSPLEKEQLLSRGYTDYLTGFTSRQGKPFAARLYFNAHNALKFSFTIASPDVASPAPWTRQELQDFVFPASYGGIPLTPTIQKQLLSNQVSEFIPQLATRNSPLKPSQYLVLEKALGPGFDFETIRDQLSETIQAATIQEVEKFLAQDKAKSMQTVNPRIDPQKSHANNEPPSSFLQKAWYKLGFGGEEEASDNRLERLRKRRKKRKFLTL